MIGLAYLSKNCSVSATSSILMLGLRRRWRWSWCRQFRIQMADESLCCIDSIVFVMVKSSCKVKRLWGVTAAVACFLELSLIFLAFLKIINNPIICLSWLWRPYSPLNLLGHLPNPTPLKLNPFNRFSNFFNFCFSLKIKISFCNHTLYSSEHIFFFKKS